MNPKRLQFQNPRSRSFGVPLRERPRPRQLASWLAPHAMSRRQLLVAASSAGLLLGSGLTSSARADQSAAPKPIPGGLDFLGDGTIFHVFAPGYPPPGSNPPETNDPSVITDFNGFVGLAYVQGMGTHLDKTTGQVSSLPFEVDLRFMTGEYVGQDGRNHHGAFALV